MHTTSAEPLRVRYYEEDDSIFLNDEYLVKGVAGRVLAFVLAASIDKGRTTFSNKEMRLDASLGLSALRDNLETRLLLLRRRLTEREPALRIPSIARGRFRLECDRP